MIPVVTELLLLSNKLSKAAGETDYLQTNFLYTCGGIYLYYFACSQGVLDFYGSENKIYVVVKGQAQCGCDVMEKYGDYLFALVGFCICTFCVYRSPCQQLSEMKEKKGWEWNTGKDETPPCTGCMRLLVSIMCWFVVILR